MMRKVIRVLALAFLALTAAANMAAPASAADAQAGKPAHYSVATTLVGTLLDDPAAVAVLIQLIPSVYANEMFKSQGRTLTLKDIQQYEPEALSDANLARIQGEFDKIPAKG
jgi:para-nitrobenzyl esterase